MSINNLIGVFGCVFDINIGIFQIFFISKNDKNSFNVKLCVYTSSSHNFLCVHSVFVCSVCSTNKETHYVRQNKAIINIM